jgi:uncharacterized protein (TIGR00162 family)
MSSSLQTNEVVYSSANMPQLHSPFLVCGFPGSGYVGKIAIDHLIQELNASHLADIYSGSFPPQIMIRGDGIAELMKNTIFYSKASTTPGSNRDMLLLTGDSQPENPNSAYFLSNQIIDIATKFNTKKIFTLAAYVTGTFVENPRIFGTATDSNTVSTFNEKNISAMDSGTIAGMNGLIIGVGKLRGLQGTCLLVETSGYVVDAKASKFVLESLLSILGVTVNMNSLEKKAQDTEALIQTIQQQAAEQQQQQQPGVLRKPVNTGYIS